MKDQNYEISELNWSMLLDLTINFFPVYTADFLLLSRNVIIFFILRENYAFSLSIFENTFMYWKRSIVVETVST